MSSDEWDFEATLVDTLVLAGPVIAVGGTVD